MNRDEIQEVVRETVKETLLSLGVDARDPMAMQRDLQHLRAWRQAFDSLKSGAMLTTVGIVVAGFLAALWAGFQLMLSRGN